MHRSLGVHSAHRGDIVGEPGRAHTYMVDTRQLQQATALGLGDIFLDRVGSVGERRVDVHVLARLDHVGTSFDCTAWRCMRAISSNPRKRSSKKRTIAMSVNGSDCRGMASPNASATHSQGMSRPLAIV